MGNIFWGILFVIFLIWLSARSKKHPNQSNQPDNINIDFTSKDYAQGYWDGYRAHQKESGIETSHPTYTATEPHKVVEQQKPSLEPHPEPHPKPVYTMGVTVNNDEAVISSAKLKEKHDLQNINITLYVASFLLVAAVGLFVATTLPESIRFIGVWVVTIAFYAAGLLLHDTVKKLRPAAVAFVGTGLAILPFTGIAMYSFILHDAAVCWFITSVIGLFAFAFASIRLQNQIVSYLTIAFATSMAISSVAVLHAALIWYFVVMIVFGTVMTFIAKTKKKWVPACFVKPIYDSSSWIVPLTIIASLLSFNNMTVRDYWIVSLVSALYYGAVAVSSVQGRDISIFVSRLLASLGLVLMTYDFTNSWTAVGLALSAVSIVQLAISVVFLPKKVQGDSNNETWLWLGLVFQLIAILFILQDASWASIVSGQLAALLVISFGLAYWLRRAIISVFGTVSLAILPIIVGYNVFKPALEVQWISITFLSLAAVTLGIRFAKKLIATHPSIYQYLLVNITLFLVESLIFTTNVSHIWGLVIWSIAALLVYGLMFIERRPWISVVSNGMILFAVYSFVYPDIKSHWVSLIFLVMAAISLGVRYYKKLVNEYPSILPFLVINFVLFLAESLVFTFNVERYWGLAIWTVATLLVYGLMYIERRPWVSIVSNLMILFTVANYIGPYVKSYWVAMIFLGLAAIALTVCALKNELKIHALARPFWVANFSLFLVESLAYTLNISFGWGFAIWLVASAMLYLLTYIERQPFFAIFANAVFLGASFWFVELMKYDTVWRGAIISWIAFISFYGAYWGLQTISKKQYSLYFWWYAVVVGGVISLMNLLSTDKPFVITAGIGLVVVTGAIAYEGWRKRQFEYIDVAAILATIGLQRILYILAPDTNLLAYTHWWSAVFAGLGYMYYAAGKRQDAKALIYFALAIMTFFTGISALGMLGEGTLAVSYQTIFIIEHLLLLTAGLVLSRKILTIWGAVAVILAVLWMIKDYGYLLLAVAAMVLIGFAIFALVRQSKNAK
ncbi:MAG: hypothetical protein NTV39_00885 [Candidatus Saccharibacteria bacterium]|nr:hypothetical protein [Candidatus Saccharibacteria bacterium]